MALILDLVRDAPPSVNALMAYKLIWEAVLLVECWYWDDDEPYAGMPSTFRATIRTKRLYPVLPESLVAWPNDPRRTLLLGAREAYELHCDGAIVAWRREQNFDLDLFFASYCGAELVFKKAGINAVGT